MQEKPSYYAIIPAEVRYDEKLKPNEKLLYGEITALTNQSGVCTASNKYFAELYKSEPETVSRWISNLVCRGYLKSVLIREKESIKGRELSIDKNVTGVLIKKSRGYCENNQEGIDKKVKENNTRYLIYKENILKEINKEKFFEDEHLNETYSKYLKMRFKKGKRSQLDADQVKSQLEKYGKENKEQLLNALAESTMNGWLGIFIKKTKESGQAPVPNWVGKEIKKQEMTAEEEAELKNMLNEF